MATVELPRFGAAAVVGVATGLSAAPRITCSVRLCKARFRQRLDQRRDNRIAEGRAIAQSHITARPGRGNCRVRGTFVLRSSTRRVRETPPDLRTAVI
jgi:hypothetical protein